MGLGRSELVVVDSHGRQLRGALAAELGQLAESIVELLKEPAECEVRRGPYHTNRDSCWTL